MSNTNPATPNSDMTSLTTLRSTFTTSLSTFASSPNTFRILHTHPPTPTPLSSPSKLTTLYILDSSFNPPSLAHLSLAKSALLSRQPPSSIASPTRLLLLLATINADKAPKPASFPDRLVLITLMARSLFSQLQLQLPSPQNQNIIIDIGVTKKPYFIDKASSIDQSQVYGEAGTVQQVHLTGFDTLTRIFDKKYYGEEEGLGVLRPFLERHRVRAVFRGEDKEGGWGSRGEQREWLEGMRRGEMEGGEAWWAERVELVEGGEVMEGVSSTRARRRAGEGDWEGLRALVGGEEATYIREKGLYQEGDTEAKGKM